MGGINEDARCTDRRRALKIMTGAATVSMLPGAAPAQPTRRAEATSEPALGAAWSRYVTTLSDLQAQIEHSEQFQVAPQQRGKGYHALFEAQAMGYNFVLAPRLASPRIFHNTSWQTEIYTLGGNGPDFDYRTVFLDGAQTYRMTGNRNNSEMLLAQVNSAMPGTPGARIVGNYDFSDFHLEKDGRFEIILSAHEHDGNWMRLDPESGYQWLLVRPTVETWGAVAASLSIERISDIAPDHYDAEDTDPATIARRIDFMTGFTRYLIEKLTIGSLGATRRTAGGINRFGEIGTETSGELGSPTARYVLADFEVADHEALIFEIPGDPGAAYWSFQLFDVWLRSIDFRTRQSTLNRRQVQRDSDGRIHLVVSRQDPQIANWLDPAGCGRGMVLFRQYRSPRAVLPVVRRVEFSELGAVLPSRTVKITPEQRQAELARRRLDYLRRHGE